MKRSKDTVQPVPTGFPQAGWLSGGLIVAAIVLIYANVINAPFIFDDGPGIEENKSIRQLWPPGPVLHPPAETGSGVAGRPIVNLSLALNYAISGLQPWSYHATNILIHALAALALFGLGCRTLEGPVLRERFAGRSVPVACGLALLWAVHPLQTESVTCIIQRTESLVGLFYLFTLYAFARAVGAVSRPEQIVWSVLSLGACTLGMATKEVMVTAPLIVLLYDRTFVSGGWREAWRRHRWLHYALIATWALLFYLQQGTPLRGGTASLEAITPWHYLLTQCGAVVLYLRLALWPHPLVLDYGTTVVTDPVAVLPQALLLAVLAGATLYALWRKPVLGFLGAWFFVILAPSSSVIPLVTQTIAEHRVYLPLAALCALGVGLLALRSARLVLPLCLGAGLVLAVLSFNRNRLYQSPDAMWRDNLARLPDNHRVRVGLAGVADKAGDFAAAVAYYEDYLHHQPGNLDARFNFARDLVKTGHQEEALRNFETVLRARPANTEVRVNYGACLVTLGRIDEARHQFELVLRVNEHDPDNHFNLAETLMKSGHVAEALAHYQRAIDLKPDAAFVHLRHGDALFRAERVAEAVAAYRTAAQLQPDLYAAWANLGGSLMVLGRVPEAIKAFETALRLKPDDPAARKNLELARDPPRR